MSNRTPDPKRSGASIPPATSGRTIEVVACEPLQENIQNIARAVLSGPKLRESLGDAKYHLLGIEHSHPEGKASDHQPDGRFRATMDHYSRQQALLAKGNLQNPESVELTPIAGQPVPSREEFDAAVQVVRADPELGPLLQAGRLRPYRPMPPVIEADGPQRILTVGLQPESGTHRHEIVGVNLARDAVVRFDRRGPAASLAAASICGLPNAFQQTANMGDAGQFQVRISEGGTELWSFLAVRPAASSGTNGSGIELRSVNYRGKKVLDRAHVPILNVRYDGDACGPYRDWQWEEGMLSADGEDVAPGFRRCPAPASTILDSDSDNGNFLGVALYDEGDETVLVSELEAGWYRYISQWRFHRDGTIRPRFGFGAVSNSCVCNLHHHHVYWRLDFDIATAENNRVRELIDPADTDAPDGRILESEVRRLKDPASNRRWRVENAETGEGYTLVPGPNDGEADDAFGVGDLWAVRFNPAEIDDGQGFTTDLNLAKAHLDPFVNGEPINGQDVVLWYAAHFAHDVNVESGHIVGPDLVPFNWTPT